MRRLAGLLMAVALGAAACGSNSSTPTTPTVAPVVFTQQILASNETGNIGGGEQTASGSSTITFNLTKDSSGNITAATVSFSATLQGFPATTNITISHIHVGAAGVAGAIVVDTGLASGQVTLVNGSGSFQKSNISVDPTLAQQIINNPAGYYFNVHSSANPSGVVRGQLVRTQ
jgi:hypothetical protein